MQLQGLILLHNRNLQTIILLNPGLNPGPNPGLNPGPNPGLNLAVLRVIKTGNQILKMFRLIELKI